MWIVVEVITIHQPGISSHETYTYRPMLLKMLEKNTSEKADSHHWWKEFNTKLSAWLYLTIDQLYRITRGQRSLLSHLPWCWCWRAKLKVEHDTSTNIFWVIRMIHLRQILFNVKQDKVCSELIEIGAEVPHVSVLGPR